MMDSVQRRWIGGYRLRSTSVMIKDSDPQVSNKLHFLGNRNGHLSLKEASTQTDRVTRAH